jgi:NAD(P)-dependent dehydrogenase (short-subunit alcohol dehydrogenase family)
LLTALPGPVDVLVNNGGPGTATIERYVPGSRQAQDLAFTTSGVLGPLWLSEAVIPGMIERGYGRVVFVASVGGGISVFPRYRIADALAKDGVSYMSRHLAAELVHTPIHVAAVCPGAVDTPMFRASTLDALDDSERERFVGRLPRRRLIQPGEIAELLWWLSTDAAAVVHGAVIDASMGLGVHPGLVTGQAEARLGRADVTDLS